jgi:NAD(P)-dependent dehydrogenase (short-subunit alcohol dehydrogenase family)
MTSSNLLSGKTALVTGATSGIGKHIAIGLARQGAKVIIGARDRERGEVARRDIEASAGDAHIEIALVDVASFASIRAFAEDVGRREPRLDVLVHNAGAWFTERRLSADGHELTFATNVLGPHLITRLVQPLLEASGSARIVNVVSSFAGDYDVDDLDFVSRAYNGLSAYKQSKQALRMLTWGQAARLAGTGITSNAAAPGFVKTGFNRNARGFMATMMGLSAKLFAVSPEKGAATPLWVASAPELAGVTGKYFDARKEKDGKFRDPEAIAALEARCDELTMRTRVRAA